MIDPETKRQIGDAVRVLKHGDWLGLGKDLFFVTIAVTHLWILAAAIISLGGRS